MPENSEHTTEQLPKSDVPRRITGQFPKSVLTERECLEIDTMLTVSKCVVDRSNLEFEEDDPTALQRNVLTVLDQLDFEDVRKHVLFADEPTDVIDSPLCTEVLQWDIKSDEPLMPKAAREIRRTCKNLFSLPIGLQQQLDFPLYMSGYMIGHATRVAILKALMAQKINSDGLGYQIDVVKAAVTGFLHDIGRLQPEQKKLSKKQELIPKSSYDFTLLKKHPELGAFMLARLYKEGQFFPADKDYYDLAWDVALCHHVRPDNDPERSYPRIISPQELTPPIKLTTLIDSFDAMATRDPKFGDEKSLAVRMDMESCYREVTRCKGTQFDPDLAELFCKVRPEIIIKGTKK